MFFAACKVVAPLADTCVEVYQVDGDNYTWKADSYIGETFGTYIYTANVCGFS